jgi:hypothetical protein
MVVAPLGKRPLYLHRQILPILVTVSRCRIAIRILVGISILVGIFAVDVSVAWVPPIRKAERNKIEIIEEMAMMAFIVVSGIAMVPKVVIPEAAIVMKQNRNFMAAARTQRNITRSKSASESGVGP